MVTISQICKKYGRTNAVTDVSLTVPDGTIFGLLGANGAGKTSTLHMLAGIITPDSGTVEVDGQDIQKHPVAVKQAIGFVPDMYSHFDRLTGWEYLHFAADMYRVPTDVRSDRLTHYLPLFELDGYVNRYIGSYSHGTKQKLMIVGSLLHQPQLWVLDEPLTGLDSVSTARLLDEMRRVRDGGGIVFFSSPVLNAVENICDAVGVIDNGRLIASGVLDEWYRQNPGVSLEHMFPVRLPDGDGHA